MREDKVRRSVVHWQRLLPIFLLIVGAGVTIVALGADLLDIGDQGSLGPTQIALVLAGCAFMLGGVGLATPAGQRHMTRFILHQSTQQLAVHLQPAGFLLLAIWFGLATGLAEVAVWAILLLFPHHMLITSPHIVWMAPLANVLLFAIPGFILFLVASRWPRFVSLNISLRIAAFILAFLGFLSLLFMVPGLSQGARLLLAIGLAVQAARLIAARPRHFFTVIRYTMGWTGILNGRRERNASPETPGSTNEAFLPSRRQFLLSAGATLAGLTVGMLGWDDLVEQHTLARLPLARPTAPNVLLIVLDTVRAQNLSLYGYSRPTTPNLERFAKTGVCFEQAISTAPWTLPSHASMFTGRWHHEVSADWYTPLDATYPTLADVLSALGYLTAGFVANLMFCSAMRGLNRGFAHYEDFPVTPGQIALSSSLGREITNNSVLRRIAGYYEALNNKNAAKINRDFLHWLSRQEQRPFFAFLNYYDAHQPYLPPDPFNTIFGPPKTQKNFKGFVNETNEAFHPMWGLSPQEVQAELEAYDGAIAYIDHHLGLLLEELAKRGVLENTLVIVTSDHGEQFGEHGLFGHTSSLYIQTLHVPLLILFPSRVPAGWHIPEPVSLRDLPATVMDLIGLEHETQFPGDSLARYWQGSDRRAGSMSNLLLSEINRNSDFALQRETPIAKGNIKSLVSESLHYIRNGDGSEELYDLENDPLETHDLVGSGKGRQLIQQFRTSLEGMLAG